MEGLNPNARDEHGLPALAVARSEEVAELLIDAGADVSIAYEGEFGEMRPIHHAAWAGRSGVVRTLLSAGADPEYAVDPSPLHSAAGEKPEDAETIRLLLEAGADPDVKNWDHKTPLHHAVARGSAAEVEVLLDAGATPDVRSLDEGFSPIHLASSPEKVNLLIDAGADPDARSNDFETRLHELCAYSSGGDETIKTIQALLDNGADLTARDASGRTPLHRVAENTHHERAGAIALTLLEEGADPDSRDKRGKTPLETARENENEPVIEALGSAGGPAKEDAGG
jgi:cytohesin